MDEKSGAGELDPQRRSGESDLQGAPASLLSGEGGFQQGQGFTQTHGAGERAQHQVVDPSLSPPTPPPQPPSHLTTTTTQRHLNASITTATLRCSWEGKKKNRNKERKNRWRAGICFPTTDRLFLLVSFPPFYFFILIIE